MIPHGPHTYDLFDDVPAVESHLGRDRREWNLIVRRPFFMNLRLGLTQNALWVGRSINGDFREVFNWLRR